MWRASKQRALGVVDTLHSPAQHQQFLDQHLAKHCRVTLAIDKQNDEVVGLIAYDSMWVHQLYIHVDYQHQGIGSRLLDLAKQHSDGSLQLHTFECNQGAQRFYEKHGFVLLEQGSCDNEEQLPARLYLWLKR